MPVDAKAPIEITAFRWVPDFAAGLVRDLRVRWALEEAGLDYRVRLMGEKKPPEYVREQPFDSTTRLMATVYASDDGAHMLSIKGAPEAVLARCAKRSPMAREPALYHHATRELLFAISTSRGHEAGFCDSPADSLLTSAATMVPLICAKSARLRTREVQQ